MVPHCWQGIKVLVFLGRIIADEDVRKRHVEAVQAAAEAWRRSAFGGEPARVELAPFSAATPMQLTPEPSWETPPPTKRTRQ